MTRLIWPLISNLMSYCILCPFYTTFFIFKFSTIYTPFYLFDVSRYIYIFKINHMGSKYSHKYNPLSPHFWFVCHIKMVHVLWKEGSTYYILLHLPIQTTTSYFLCFFNCTISFFTFGKRFFLYVNVSVYK